MNLLITALYRFTEGHLMLWLVSGNLIKEHFVINTLYQKCCKQYNKHELPRDIEYIEH